MGDAGSKRNSRRAFLEAFLATSAYALVPTLVRADAREAAQHGALLRKSERPPNYESVRSTFTSRITATDRFYVRNHFDAPTIDLAKFRLAVGGNVQKSLSLSIDELRAMPQVDVEAVLQCAGNGRALFRPRVPGVQWLRGAVGNAVFRGVRLAEVLERAGVDRTSRFVQLAGADRPTLPTTPRFVRALPLVKALHEDTLIALDMNGAPLSPLHGAPARLVVPGWMADGWTKWLSELTVQNSEPAGFFYETAYRYPIEPIEPGSAVPPEKMQPMSQLNVKSIIGSHDHGDVLRAGKQDIVGVAFAGEAGIAKVEVSVDGGQTWADARLEESPSRYGFVRFTHSWNASSGPARLVSRATDRKGAVQPDKPAWNPSGYLYNALDPVDVEVRA